MATGLLDLHDSNLQLWHGNTHLQSPGYALLQGDDYLFGAPARAAARLQPREVNTRYWWRLSTEALQPALGPARHTGDLVHAHLLQLHEQAGQPDELLLAVPGSMQRDQLGLLLGIVQQCPFNAIGLVHRSVALGSLFNTAGKVFHLEIQLHQSLVSELAPNNGTLELHNSTPLPGCGLLQLQERLVELIATEFVRQTRFDPRRKAATEQQLYDALPGALHALGAGADTNLDINGYQARLSAQQLQGAGQRLFDSASAALSARQAGDLVIADALAALLPGLSDAIPGLQFLEGNDIRNALQQHSEHLTQRSETLNFIKALPCLSMKENATKASAPASPAMNSTPSLPSSLAITQPTHLLVDHVARPLDPSGTELANGWAVYRDDAGWQLRGAGASIQVNGTPWRQGQVLAAGDSIAIDGADAALLIEVEPQGDC